MENDMLGLSIQEIISRLITLVIAFTLHEFAHAKTADLLGDDTPRAAGRLTLNPLAHLDPFGTLMLILAGFGWAKPVPINPYALRRKTPAGTMLVSVAGPLTNLLLATLGALLIRFGVASIYTQPRSVFPTLGGFLLEFVYINVALFLFNLIPLAPLDGEKVLEYLLPAQWREGFYKIRQYGPIFLLLLVIVGPQIGFDLFGTIIREPLMRITRFLIGA
ncbi:MAG: site-2 protease family protein [Anaerolineaceae bacterium]|nr:site-2 protease family protein [Anaerolineaceae bacterium]